MFYAKNRMEIRLYLALIGVNLVLLALFFFIISSLLKFYGESTSLFLIEISFVLIGCLMIFIGLKGFKRNTPKTT